jgi:hypothetical protein
MPDQVLYGVITFLGLGILALGGLWVRAHDQHRQWSVEKITDVEKELAVIKTNHQEIKDDIREIKESLKNHLDIEQRFQKALITHLNLKV